MIYPCGKRLVRPGKQIASAYLQAHSFKRYVLTNWGKADRLIAPGPAFFKVVVASTVSVQSQLTETKLLDAAIPQRSLR